MTNGILAVQPNATPALISLGIYNSLLGLSNARIDGLEKNAMTAAPAVVMRNCGVHVAFHDDDGFFGRTMRSSRTATAYTLPNPWPTSLDTDPICDARAPGTQIPTSVSVSSASYNLTGPVAPDSIVTAFGNHLATTTVTAPTNPWPTTLGGVQVSVTDNTGTVTIAPTAPGLYSANTRGSGVAAGYYLRVTSVGAPRDGLLFDPQTRADTGMRGGPVAQSQYQGLDQINLGPLTSRLGYGQ
jgi:hypothetical protein